MEYALFSLVLYILKSLVAFTVVQEPDDKQVSFDNRYCINDTVLRDRLFISLGIVSVLFYVVCISFRIEYDALTRFVYMFLTDTFTTLLIITAYWNMFSFDPISSRTTHVLLIIIMLPYFALF